MSLEDLNQKIHRPDYKPEGLPESLPFTPEAKIESETLPHAPTDGKDAWTESMLAKKTVEKPKEIKFADPKTARRKKIALVAGCVALLLLVGGIVFRSRTMLFATDKVIVSMTGPQSVESHESTTFKIFYENRNWIDLEDATLVVSYPSSFHLEDAGTWDASEARAELSLGTIEGNAKGTIELRGSFHAIQNQTGGFQVVLRYAPKGMSSRYDTSTDWRLGIASSPITLDVDAPLQVGNDQTMEYTVEYRNESGETLDNMRLKFEYPEGFRFIEGEPRPSEGEAIWYVGTIAPGGMGKVKARGTITGVKNDVKRFVVRLGKPEGNGNFRSFSETEHVTKIVASPIGIRQVVNGMVDGSALPGDSLDYSIHFQNEGDLGLRDLIVTVDLDATYLDTSKLVVDRGSYNAATRQILYKASDIPDLGQLEPGESGSVKFSVPVRESSAVTSSGAKNIAIETVARIDSPDVPTPIGANKVIASNITRVKLFSQGTLTALGAYYDGRYPNSGPIPPKVGQETTYSLTFRIKSDLNDVTKSRVVITLPSKVRYVTKRGEMETVVWNERAGELVWEVGTLTGGQGGSRELVVQIAVTPDESLIGKTVPLLYKAVFFGEDDFSGREMRAEVGEKNSSLSEDALMPALGGTVVP